MDLLHHGEDRCLQDIGRVREVFLVARKIVLAVSALGVGVVGLVEVDRCRLDLALLAHGPHQADCDHDYDDQQVNKLHCFLPLLQKTNPQDFVIKS